MVGFDAKNKLNLDSKFICPVCSLILREPVQLSTCGHRQCQSCFNNEFSAIAVCPSCQEETQQTEEHLDQLHLNPKCEYCDKQFNSVDALNQHKVSECQKLTISCILKDYGCTEQIIRYQIEEHYLNAQHQESILKVVRLMQSQLQESQIDIDLSRTTTATTNDPATAQLQELYQTINILAGGIEALNDDGERLSNESLKSQIQVQTLTEDIPKVQLSVEESHGFLQGVKHNQDILNQDLVSLKEKINDMQYVSYDGTFVWKITNFKEKMMDAQSERQTSIYSPPFYSSPTGYKMRARLYLHGDGNARRTHMSMFFVLMRGLNDPILKFPFNYKVTFCMYDQTSAQRHIIDSFRPDIRSNSFQRPRSDMNIASGIPKFFPLAMIEQEGNPYVQDDTMFIKIMVDFSDMPKTLLPYALSLNPGLPLHIRQMMIQLEVERKAQQQPQQQTPPL